ncbi:amidohydrolase family protein [Sphingomonas crocodyli]|uniref:Hydrolase n=1 Tax=Sphingomonas crocodyli TaxID=1979270 RepID=A0A437LY17_9SPHN|nr:amidohydrolase family protein [Sphingomonas crocodyli]RVT90226.1 hydrolase [Sphingomonas crocodyli]
MLRTSQNLLVIILALASLPAGSEGIRAEPLTLYANATLIDGTGSPPRPHQDILVRGERIIAIASRGQIADVHVRNARRIDLSGQFIMPGLIDSHVHLATPPDPAKAMARLSRAVYGGVTAVRDMADDLRSVAELARAARAGEIASPDIVFAAVMAGPSFFADARAAAVSAGYIPGTAPWMQAVDNRTDLREAVAIARGTGASAIKIYADLDGPQVNAIASEARRQHMHVWAHGAVFPASPAEIVAARPEVVSHICYLAYELEPVMPAAYERRIAVSPALPKGDDDPVIGRLYEAMRRQGTIIDATGSLFVRAEAQRRTLPQRRPLRCNASQTIRLTRQAVRAGVPISTGTDYETDLSSLWPEVHDELFYLTRDVGMKPLEVIRAATLVGAQAAGQIDEMGTVASGKLANFIVLSQDPSIDIGNIRAIIMTVKRGRPYRRADYRPASRAKIADQIAE